MPGEPLRVTVDKFTFLIPSELDYTDSGVWVAREGGRARLGLTDYAQQRSGDIAFAKVKPMGTRLQRDDEFAEIETVKVNQSFPSPLQGVIAEINAGLETYPERINQDPYGKGWLAVVELADWERDRQSLMDAAAYAERVRTEAEAETQR